MLTKLSFMREYFPFLWLFLFFQFIFPFLLFSQERLIKIGDESFSTILKEDYPINELPGVTYSLHKEDFLLAKGQGFQGNPPDSNASFSFEGETIKNIGDFNNKIISLLLSTNDKDFALAKKMAEAGRSANPIYLPIRYNLGRIYSFEGRFKDSLREFFMARDIFPEYYRTHLHIGFILEAMKNFREAESSYKKAYRLVYLPEEPNYYLCSLSFRTGEGTVFRNLAQKKPGEDLSFLGSLCHAEKELLSGKKKSALSFLKNLRPEKETSTIPGKYFFMLGELAFESSQKELAINNYKIILEKKYDPLFLTVNRKTLERKYKELQIP
jgi:tetratricopeptide (TPR) repeat protein